MKQYYGTKVEREISELSNVALTERKIDQVVETIFSEYLNRRYSRNWEENIEKFEGNIEALINNIKNLSKGNMGGVSENSQIAKKIKEIQNLKNNSNIDLSKLDNKVSKDVLKKKDLEIILNDIGRRTKNGDINYNMMNILKQIMEREVGNEVGNEEGNGSVNSKIGFKGKEESIIGELERYGYTATVIDNNRILYEEPYTKGYYMKRKYSEKRTQEPKIGEEK